jgi:hypothetical protein
MKNDRNTTFLQQVYNSPLTWGGPHALWSPPHVRGLLYTCCKSVVRESVLFLELLVTPQLHNKCTLSPHMRGWGPHPHVRGGSALEV